MVWGCAVSLNAVRTGANSPDIHRLRHRCGLAALLVFVPTFTVAQEMGPPAPCGARAAGLEPCAQLPDPPPVRLSPRLAFYTSLAVADLATTELYLHRNVPEGNRLMRNRGVRLALEAGVAYGSAKIDQWASRKGKPWLVWTGRGLAVVGTGLIVKHNLDAYRAAGRRP